MKTKFINNVVAPGCREDKIVIDPSAEYKRAVEESCADHLKKPY